MFIFSCSCRTQSRERSDPPRLKTTEGNQTATYAERILAQPSDSQPHLSEGAPEGKSGRVMDNCHLGSVRLSHDGDPERQAERRKARVRYKQLLNGVGGAAGGLNCRHENSEWIISDIKQKILNA